MLRKHIYNPLRRQSGLKAAYWLYRELNLQNSEKMTWDLFLSVLTLAIWRDEALYRRYRKKKKSGKVRVILAPEADLKLIQRQINRCLLATESRPEYSHGFSGGSIVEALKPHLESGHPIFTADVKDAFPSTHGLAVYNVFRKLGYGKHVSYFLTCLTTWPVNGWFRSALPQGPPTSPRLFDLCFRPIDEKLQKLATQVGGIYTRYADNIFFSAPDFRTRDFKKGSDYLFNREGKKDQPPVEKNQVGKPQFHATLVSAIFRDVEEGYYFKHYPNKTRHYRKRELNQRQRRQLRECLEKQIAEKQLGPRAAQELKATLEYVADKPAEWLPNQLTYELHKCYLWHPKSGHAFKALGLQIIDGRLNNSKDYKQRLRLLTHHMDWLLKNKRPFETEVWPIYQQLNGLAQFAVRDTLSPKLLTAAEEVLCQAEQIRYSGPGHTWTREITTY